MFKLAFPVNTSYCEIPQTNPLRWRIMFREGDTLTSQSGLIKCKDFFNDVVAWNKAQAVFSIYNFNNKVKFNEEGLYFHLTNIADNKRFIQNIEKAINPKLVEGSGLAITCYDQAPGEVVICIPMAAWESTYIISLLTMLIRVCNYAPAFEDWNSLFAKDSPLCSVETAFSPETLKFTQEHGFVLPDAFKGEWYYSTSGYCATSGKAIRSGIIHNNGANGWVGAMTAATAMA